MDTNNYFSGVDTSISDTKAKNSPSSIDSSIIPNTTIDEHEYEIITKIEILLSTHIPEVLVIQHNKSGFKIKNGVICELSISYAECDRVFPLICTLLHLEKLLLNKATITYIPHEIKNLRHLKVLELNHNLITIIPQELLVLPSLKLLDLSFNKLKEFHTTEKDLIILETLILDHNSLEIVSFSNGSCPNLQECFLQYNKITKCQINALFSIEMVILHNNILQIFPAINNLLNLEQLELHFNHLTTIQSDFSHLKHLSSLSLSYNDLSNIDFSLFPQNTITFFFINGNPLSKQTQQELRHFKKN